MNLDFFTARLAANVTIFEGLVGGVGVEQARWKPAPERWSLAEVMGHVRDEEVEDFRQRLDYTLHRPGEAWPKIDPQGWVKERAYNERDLQESLRDFVRERERSLAWLKGLQGPDWSVSAERPQGVLAAGDILASWVAHDLLHVRQMTRLHYEYVALAAAPYRTKYAGDWPSAG